MKKTNRTVVHVEWVDSSMPDGWQPASLKGDMKMKVCRCYSVGLLLSSTKESVTVAGHWGEDPEQACGIMTIPRCAIKSIVTLEKWRDER